MLFYLLLWGGPEIPKIKVSKSKVSNSKVSNSKVSNSKVSNSKVSNALLTFHRKESNCLLRDFLVSVCETLLCVERLACIFEIIGPLHIISHERRRKQTTNRGLSAGLRCRSSCFPVWCDKRRQAQTTNRGLSASLRCEVSYFPVWCCPARYWSVAVREDDRENSMGDRVGPLRTPSNRRKEPSIITRSQQEGYARSKK
jgi:hypothetical protein